MSARTGRPLLSLALLVALGAAFAWQLGRAERPLPRPTEHRLDEAGDVARPALPDLKQALEDQPNKYIVRVANKAANDLEGTENAVP